MNIIVSFEDLFDVGLSGILLQSAFETTSPFTACLTPMRLSAIRLTADQITNNLATRNVCFAVVQCSNRSWMPAIFSYFDILLQSILIGNLSINIDCVFY